MKKTTGFVCLFCIIMILACGPSKKEEYREKAIQDSIAEIDRQSVLDDANAMLADSLAVDTANQENK